MRVLVLVRGLVLVQVQASTSTQTGARSDTSAGTRAGMLVDQCTIALVDWHPEC